MPSRVHRDISDLLLIYHLSLTSGFEPCNSCNLCSVFRCPGCSSFEPSVTNLCHFTVVSSRSARSDFQLKFLNRLLILLNGIDLVPLESPLTTHLFFLLHQLGNLLLQARFGITLTLRSPPSLPSPVSLRLRRISSSSSGSESTCIRSRAASVHQVNRLVGQNRSVMYRLESRTAADDGIVLMRTLWCVSYRSFRPRKILLILLISSGSSTITTWNLRSKALSFESAFGITERGKAYHP